MLSRRRLLGRAGALALATIPAVPRLSAGDASSSVLPGLPHHRPTAKRIVLMLHGGAPPQLDLFDYKPGLEKLHGQEIPPSVLMGQKLSTMTSGQKSRPILPSITPFKQYGQAGTWLSEWLPHTGSIADDICLIRSMRADAVNHAPAMTQLLTGAELPGRPSLGAWLDYAYGPINPDLPAYTVMTSRDKEASCGQLFFDFYWSAGFLPSRHQGVQLQPGRDPVLYLADPPGVSAPARRAWLDDLAALNRLRGGGDPETATRIAQYALAGRMQGSMPEAVGIEQEPQSVLDLYGPDVKRPGSFAMNCLRARRLLERGVRCVQLMHAGWDHHKNLTTQMRIQCQDTDQPAAGLVKDLKQRGLLDDTIVVWAAEFGRTPFLQGDLAKKKDWGRDHHPYAYSMWMAGGGVKRGLVYGTTDDFAFNVVDKPVHLHDLQATLLHLLGINHERLTFKFQGRPYRLTDVHGHVVKDVIA